MLNFFRKYSIYFFYLIIYLLFIAFLNIISYNEELVIAISIIMFFSAICSLLRKFILYFFYLECDYIYTLIFTIFGLNLIYITALYKYLNTIFFKIGILKNIRLFLLNSLLISYFKSSHFYFIYYIKEVKDNLESFYKKINKLSYTVNFNIPAHNTYIYCDNQYIIDLYSGFLSTMFLYTVKMKNISLYYVS